MAATGFPQGQGAAASKGAPLLFLKREPSFHPAPLTPPQEEAEEADAPPRSENGPSKKGKGRRVVRALLLFLAAALLATGGVAYYRESARFETTDNAYISGDVHPVNSRINGVIEKVFVDDNQHVNAGDPLFSLDSRDEAVKLEQAKAKLVETAAQADQVRADIAQAEAKIAENGAQLAKAQADYQRASELVKDRVISRQEYDTAVASFKSTTASSSAATAMLNGAKAKLVFVNAQMETAKAAVKDAGLQLSYTLITAPVAGQIGKKVAEVGQQVQPGQAVMAVVEDNVWVTANLKETQLAHLRPGQPAEVTVDAIPGHQFEGKVDSVAPGSGAQFALLPPDNATGNFTKVVQRVPVKIVFNPGALKGFEGRLVPGLSVLAKVQVLQK